MVFVRIILSIHLVCCVVEARLTTLLRVTVFGTNLFNLRQRYTAIQIPKRNRFRDKSFIFISEN